MNRSRKTAVLFVSFCGLTHWCHAQAIGPTVEIVTETKVKNFVLPQNGTMAGEFKSLEQNISSAHEEPFWHWYSEVGYTSEYNFRGTNLTPNSDGAGAFDLEMSHGHFSLGLYAIHQFGTASAPGFSIGEGGGAGMQGISGVGRFFPETVQNRFNEIDVFVQYSYDIGPVRVTVGNIAFFIERSAETFLNLPDLVLPGPPPVDLSGIYGPYATVADEQFDRLFVRLSTSIIPHIQPWITYYQTIFNSGHEEMFYSASGPLPHHFLNVIYAGQERSAEEYGGYLEGRLRGNFPLNRWIELNPYGVISYSFGDRSVPVSNPKDFNETLRGKPLRGFNAAQFGIEMPIHLFQFTAFGTAPRLSLVPFGVYSYHISTPTAGTDRNEIYGGGKLTLSF